MSDYLTKPCRRCDTNTVRIVEKPNPRVWLAVCEWCGQKHTFEPADGVAPDRLRIIR